MTQQELINKALECGFTNVTPLDVSTLKALPEVREMCAVNTCGAYGKRWSCPPGCGEIEECQAKMNKYAHGILLQTVSDIEDSMDWEGIMEAKKRHDKNWLGFSEFASENLKDKLILGDGGCRYCKECTYPDAPCRFPKKASASMEAFGLLVSDVCKSNGAAYNYGPGKMCYSGCLLYND